MISICALIKENRLNARTRQNASGVTLKMQSGSYLQRPHWTLSKYNIVPLQQLSGSLEGWRLQGNELRINLSTYQDISKSAEVQGDFRNLSGTWRSAALAGRGRLPVGTRLFSPFNYAASFLTRSSNVNSTHFQRFIKCHWYTYCKF